MDGPITNFEFGKMQHREYETLASRNWNRGATPEGKPAKPKRHKLVWTLIGVGLGVWLIAQMIWVNVRADAL